MRSTALVPALAILAATLVATPAAAQPRVEVGALVGWTLSDGVDGDPRLASDGNVYDEVNVADSVSFGLDLGVFVSENAQVGFLYGRQQSTLEVKGTQTVEVGDLPVSTYHGYFAYNFGEGDAPVRPYVMLGLGATTYGNVSYTGIGNVTRETGSETQFSGTVGAGVKIYPSPNVGVRFGARFTPTYIKSDAEGWWCDPYWGGCYLVSSAQYSNQFEFSGGLTFRF
jgi:outer membrane protein W